MAFSCFSFARRSMALGGALIVLASATTAHAVIYQVDGTLLPVQGANCPTNGAPNGCVQVGLNIGEGLPANSTTNPLNAIFDARTSPEVFSVPFSAGTYGTVTVTDLIEGAGFENTFGWYNVSDPSTLYPIVPCADEPGATRTVDFQAEFVAGNYLGGFIGFFLITPEDVPGNCGQLSNIGYIYFTEQAINGDGNYVHYLSYQSVADNQRFYFGFEDLFRGGDNDFEDMFLQVDGLILPCVPSAEVCDGDDNNCDGLVDNNPVDAGSQCGATDVGECEYGIEVCQNGSLVCVGQVVPTLEVCDTLDNNCNGVADDNPIGQGAPCGTDVGECQFGVDTCIGGVFVCVGGVGPSNEVCDGLDNNCNGTDDDNTIDTGGPCGSNLGVCMPGTLVCNNGMIDCSGGFMGGMEMCNGLDDDCNGAVDDGNPGGGAMCGTDVGVCESGVEACVGGGIICVGAIGPTDEICDGLDNNCDGVADELAPCPNGSQCVEGVCAAPCGGGEFPCPGGQICMDGFCIPGSCDDVTCADGEVCQQGICVPDGSTGGAGGGMGSGAMSVGGSAEGGSGNAGGDQTGGAGAAPTGGASDTDAWGLATGGGGLACSISPSRDTSTAAWLALLGLGLVRRRRQRRTGGGVR